MHTDCTTVSAGWDGPCPLVEGSPTVLKGGAALHTAPAAVAAAAAAARTLQTQALRLAFDLQLAAHCALHATARLVDGFERSSVRDRRVPLPDGQEEAES